MNNKKRSQAGEKPIDVSKIKTVPSRIFIIKRSFKWIIKLAKLRIKFRIQNIRKKNTPEWQAKQIREFMQEGGTVTLKLGQQLSIRTDRLDPILCEELKKLLDKVPPMPIALSTGIIEQSLNKKTYEVFSSFDPNPIGSGSISCVYKAHLISGSKVAVKVLRMTMIRELRADLKIIQFFAKKSEDWGLVKKNSLTDLTDELSKMLLEEIDFRTEARYTELFRKDTKKLNYVTAPKIHNTFTRKELLVIEFCEGCFLVNILKAIEKNDRTFLEDLSKKGLDLEKVATRLSHLLYWELFEGDFFHADPHPANILVKPNNKLTLIDFGSCGSVSTTFKEEMQNFMHYCLLGDPENMAKSMLATSEPLPVMDVELYITETKELIKDWYFRQRSKHAIWSDKTSAAVFFKSMANMKKYDIRVSPELVRHARANMLFDTIIFRLRPKLDLRKVYRKYLKDMYKRKSSGMKKEMKLRKKQKDGLLDSDYLQIKDQMQHSKELKRMSSSYMRTPRYRFYPQISKESKVSSSFIRFGFNLVKLFILFTSGRLLYVNRSDLRSLADSETFVQSLTNAASWTMSSPYFYLSVVFIVFFSIRKISTLLDKPSVRDVRTEW